MARLSEFLGDIRGWVVRYRREILFFAIMFFVALLSFGLGYLANRELNHAPIVIEKTSE